MIINQQLYSGQSAKIGYCEHNILPVSELFPYFFLDLLKFAADKDFTGEKFNAISLGQGQVRYLYHNHTKTNPSMQTFTFK